MQTRDAIAKAWTAGDSGPAIAAQLGITRQRVSQVVKLLGLPPRVPRESRVQERFWDHIDRGEGCWLWRGQKRRVTAGRYGHVLLANGEKMYAHRAAWIFTYGPIPDEAWVLHHCDNPTCVRPDHLFLGTQTDNMRDASSKKRLRPRGTPQR